MRSLKMYSEDDLASLAKRFRLEAKRTRAEAARELDVSRPSVFHAEEKPDMSLTKLRARMIEQYSPYVVSGPHFLLTRRAKHVRATSERP